MGCYCFCHKYNPEYGSNMNLSNIWYRIKDFVSDQRSRYTGNVVYTFQYDKALTHPRDYNVLLNNNLSWVYIATAKNSQELAKTKIRLYVAKKPGKKIIARTKRVDIEQKLYLYQKANLGQFLGSSTDIEEITEHPALDLLKNVNGFANRFDLREKTDLFQELTGNAYWYVVKNEIGIPVEIWVIPPDRMWVVPSREEFIAGYIYKFGSTEIPFDEDEIIHFKFPSATSQFYGDSPLFAVSGAYNILHSQQVYQ
ncbi:MAG TPA: phage portal protein, partial [bacterium]|nr:phage portal protein [bacterium]